MYGRVNENGVDDGLVGVLLHGVACQPAAPKQKEAQAHEDQRGHGARDSLGLGGPQPTATTHSPTSAHDRWWLVWEKNENKKRRKKSERKIPER